MGTVLDWQMISRIYHYNVLSIRHGGPYYSVTVCIVIFPLKDYVSLSINTFIRSGMPCLKHVWFQK